MATEWAQKKVKLPAKSRGCHVITSEIYKQVPELLEFEMGLANLWSAHHSLVCLSNAGSAQTAIRLLSPRPALQWWTRCWTRQTCSIPLLDTSVCTRFRSIFAQVSNDVRKQLFVQFCTPVHP